MGGRRGAQVGGDESLADTLSRLTTTPDSGLDEAEAARRLLATGLSELPPPPRRPVVLRFLDQLREPMNLLLLGAAVVSGGALREVSTPSRSRRSWASTQ